MQSNVGRGLTNADIINDDAKLARVRLEGEVNGVPFIVERAAVRRCELPKLPKVLKVPKLVPLGCVKCFLTKPFTEFT